MNLSMNDVCFDRNPQKIALLTDSCADLSAEQRAGTPIFVLPLKIRCRDGEFSDGVDIFASDIYTRQAAGELPQTSLPDGGSVKDTLDRIAALGYEKVIAIHLSSGLSGTYNMVRLQGLAREDLEVAVFDSLSGSLGIGITLLQVWEDIQSGRTWSDLVERRVPALIRNTYPYFSVDSWNISRRAGVSERSPHWPGPCSTSSLWWALPGTASSPAWPKSVDAKPSRGSFWSFSARAAEQRQGRRYNLAVANGGAPEEMAQLRQSIAAACRRTPALLAGGDGRYPQRLYRLRRAGAPASNFWTKNKLFFVGGVWMGPRPQAAFL